MSIRYLRYLTVCAISSGNQIQDCRARDNQRNALTWNKEPFMRHAVAACYLYGLFNVSLQADFRYLQF